MQITLKRSLITLIVVASLYAATPNPYFLKVLDVVLPKVYAANTKEVCKTVYDTITSASGNTSQKARQVCETVVIPDPIPVPEPVPVYIPPVDVPVPVPVYQEPVPEPLPVYIPPVDVPTPAPVYHAPTPAPAPEQITQIFTKSTPEYAISLTQKDILDKEMHSIFLRALWRIKELISQFS